MAFQPYTPNAGGMVPIPNMLAPQLPQVRLPPSLFFPHMSWTPIPTPIPVFKPRPFHRPPKNATFTLFPHLPPELRLRIWAYAAPRNRVIEIRSWGSGHYAPIRFSVTPHRLPIIFRVCHESRQEALRLYTIVNIGISAAQLYPDRKYVDWKYHPRNPNADPAFTAGTAPLPYAIPHQPVKVYVWYASDTIYLGPEFHSAHLHAFLTTMGTGQELSGLQHVALAGGLWKGSRDGRWDECCEALYALKSRPVKEVMIIPDDGIGALEDKYYYRRHEIRFQDPAYAYKYHHQPYGEDKSQTMAENLVEWFERLWNHEGRQEREPVEDGGSEEMDWYGDGDGIGQANTVAEQGRQVPKVGIKSVRRNGQAMSDFKNGVWAIQERMGDMMFWKTWSPPQAA